MTRWALLHRKILAMLTLISASVYGVARDLQHNITTRIKLTQLVTR